MTRNDPLELEVFRHMSGSIVDEIETNLSRTAYSPLIYEYKDYCVAWLTPDFRLLTQSKGSLPIFLANMGAPVRDAAAIIGQEDLAPGDTFLTNYSPVAGQHLNNVITARPVFTDDELVGFIVIRAHWADLGGLVTGSISWDSREIFHEGIQFRGLRVTRADRVIPEVLATIRANTRLPEYVSGDLIAQIAGCRMGELRWNERVAKRWSPAEIRDLTELQWRASDRFARSKIDEIPEGTYKAKCLMDDDGVDGGQPMPVSLSVTVSGDEMAVDLGGLPGRLVAPMNAGRIGGAVSAVRVAYKSILAPEYPADEGLFEALTVEIPDDRVLSATGDAPMGHWYSLLPTVIDLVLRALGAAVPGKVPAGHHGTMGLFSFFGRRSDGGWWQFIDTHLGGWGGSAQVDGGGPFKTLYHGDNRDIPVEVLEARFPLRVHSYGFVPDSAGLGEHRGGFGTEKLIEILDECFMESALDRTLDPPWGLAGGLPGKPGDIEVRTAGDQDWVSRRRATRYRLPRQSLVRVRSAGGGGWGPVSRRTASSWERDQLAGLVTEAKLETLASTGPSERSVLR